MSLLRAAALATLSVVLGVAGGRGGLQPGRPATPAGPPVVTLDLRELDGPLPHWVYQAVFSADGGLVAAGAKDAIHVWSVDGGKPVARMRLPAADSRRVNLAFTADGKSLVSAGDLDPKVRFFDVKTGKQTREVDYPGRLPPDGNTMPFRAFAPGAAVMAVDAYRRGGGDETGIDLVDLTTGKVAARIPAPDGTSWTGCDFSPDGKLLATTGERDAVRLFDTTTGKLVRELRAGKTLVSGRHGTGAIRFSPDGRFLVACEHTGRIEVFDKYRAVVWGVADGTRYVGVPDLGGPGMTADNRALLVGGAGAGETYLHDLLTGQNVPVRNPPAKGRWLVGQSRDGKNHVRNPPVPPAPWRWLVGQSRDGKTLAFASASVGPEGVRVALAAAPVLPEPLTGTGPPTPAGLALLWAGWASDSELRRAYAWKFLGGHPDAVVGYAGEQLAPVPAADTARVDDLIKLLDDDSPDARDRASAALAATAHAWVSRLTAAHTAAGPGEARNRLTAVLRGAKEAPPPPALTVALRGVALLEKLGTPAAKDLLGRLAKGAAGARLTDEAAAAIKRLDK